MEESVEREHWGLEKCTWIREAYLFLKNRVETKDEIHLYKARALFVFIKGVLLCCLFFYFLSVCRFDV